MSPEFNFEELKAADRLPSPPGVALAILELTRREDAGIEELLPLVQADPALSSRLLRFANSPLIAPRRPIAAVRDAVALIGLNGVRNLALGLSLVGHYRTGQCPGFDYARFWGGSLAAAVAAAALATAWPKEYGQCLQEAGGDDLTAVERRYFMVDHPTLTELLLRDWRLPAYFIEALRLSRQPPPETGDRPVQLARLFALADLIRRWCLGVGAEERKTLQARLEPGLAALAPGLEAGEALLRIEAEWHAWGKLIDIPTTPPQPVRPASRLSGEEASLPGLKTLVVDDDPMLLARLGKQLRQAGHRVDTARDGREALQRIIEDPPQLVITDWHMHPMDGLSLCRTLRDSPLGGQLYLIMLTASETEDDLVRAFASGIDDYVTKPVSLRVLLARTRAAQRILALQEALQQKHVQLEQRARELTLTTRRLEQLAHTDLLTGLPNRRYGLKRLEQALEEAGRHNRPLGVMILDLDHFKSVNDTLGHAAGDRVLKHAARILSRAMRASDVLCRWGGEEFLAILPQTDPAATVHLAERMRTALMTAQPRGLSLGRPVTVSIGAASWPRAGDLDQLLNQADRALYRAKEQGRNRVEMAGAP